jgi:cytochrome oxidase assembly protein ShyY1
VRHLLSPRWLGLHVLAIALIGAFAWLGHWQLDRARELQQPTSGPDPAPVGLSSIDPASTALSQDAAGRLVTVVGHYDPAHAYLVPGRQQAGRSGYWVLNVVRLTDGTGVLVVRGWTPSARILATQAPTAGQVAITGRLQQAEPPPDATTSGLPAGQLGAVSPVALLSTVGFPLHDGYVVLRSQSPPALGGLELVPSPRGQVVSVPGFYLQHLAYALLWWLFAAFTAFFWFRLVRDDLAEHAGPVPVPPDAPGYAP